MDARRSLKRYVAEALPDYEVRLAEEDGVFTRPFALVAAQGDLAALPGPTHTIDVQQLFVVSAYPVPLADAQESWAAAEACREALFTAFEIGVGAGARRRIPLYDYDGVSFVQASSARFASDYMRATDVTLTALPDPDDPLLWQVTASLRCGFRRRGRVPSGQAVDSVSSGPA